MRSKCRWVVWLTLTALFGCDDSSVSVCIGDVIYCNQVFKPVAKAGPDQTVVAGALVTLDGSSSEGNIQSYSWAQTSGPPVALTNANKAHATFVAPTVVATTRLTFRLTVVNSVDEADTASTDVTVNPAPAALVVALALLQGPLQPASTAAEPATSSDGVCASLAPVLPPDQNAAQLGLWLAARSLAIAKGFDTEDPSGFLDAARVLVATRPAPTADVPGQLETFGFVMLGALAVERDPALHAAIVERLVGATMLADPAGLLNGRARVGYSDRVVIAAAPDPVQVTEAAAKRLVQWRAGCVDATNALELTAAGLRVIANSAVVDD